MQWAKAQQTGQFKAAPTSTGEAGPEEVATIGSLMAFDGAAPELINGRLAMLGFFAALGAEISSGEGVLQQVNINCLLSYTVSNILAANLTNDISPVHIRPHRFYNLQQMMRLRCYVV